MPSTFSEGLYPSDWLKGEQMSPLLYSRETVAILAGSGAARSLTSGMVIGKATKGAASAVAGGSNTGGGTMGAITVGAAAVPGVYTLRITKAASGAGDFELIDPDGDVVGLGTVGVAFDKGGLAFTLADGAPDFVVGDSFTITVAAGTGKVVQIDFAETDGSEDAYGILLDDAEAEDGVDGEGVAIVRNATIVATKITWPAGASAAQKSAALAQLAAQGIITRKGE